MKADLCPWFNMAYYNNTRDGNRTFRGHYKFSPEGTVVLTFAYVIVSVLAVFGNSLVIWIIVKSSRLQRFVINYFIANLAIADLVMGLLVVPIQIPLVGLNEWPSALPHIGCPLLFFVRDLTINVAVFTLVAIAYLRKQVLTNPFRVRTNPLSLTYVKLQIFCIWVVATIMATPTFFACEVCYYFDMVSDKKKFHCNEWKMTVTENMSYYFPLWCGQYLAPVCVITYLYFCSAKTLRPDPLLTNSGEWNKSSAKAMAKVTKAFAFCWLFVQMYRLMRMLNWEVDRLIYSNVYWFLFNWLAMSNSCYNPFIYGIFSRNFRDELRKRFLVHENWTKMDDFFEKLTLSISSFRNSSQSSNQSE